VSELLDIARDIVGHAARDEQIEAYVTHEREFQVKAFKGEVESLSSAEPRGVGIRVIAQGRAGFAYTTDLSADGLSAAIVYAQENARHSTPDDAVALPEGWEKPPADLTDLFDESLAGVSPEDKVAFALELERATSSVDPRIRAVEDAVYADSISEVAIATSSGIEGHYRRSDAWCYSVAIATEGDDTQIGFEFDLARSIAGLDAEAVARRAADRATSVLGARKIPSRPMPVVFDPYTAGQFLGVIGSVLTGEAVQKGRSLFAGKLGEKVAGEGITLVDDGRAAGAPGSSPWDAEGVATSMTEVIKDGTLTSLLYDTVSARRDGVSSTGNASRAGFKSVPHPSPSNLHLKPTGGTRADVMKSAGRAFLVQDLHGVHSGANPISGDFSVGATGFLLVDGSPEQPVKEVTIAAPMLEILARIQAVADDLRWLPFGGSYGGATTLVSEMTVAGA
jgi:PmbA protein